MERAKKSQLFQKNNLILKPSNLYHKKIIKNRKRLDEENKEVYNIIIKKKWGLTWNTTVKK